jgi:hypothetical protein
MPAPARHATPTWLLWITLICSIGSWHSAQAQVMGEKAEMGRLQGKAEDAMANDDPDGAAMAMGRAALMAAQLSKKEMGPAAQVYRAQEALFRSQEHTYRAVALFRRAGGQLPASSGVCGSLSLAQGTLHHAVELVPAAASQPVASDIARLHEATDNWATVIDALVADYQCP